MYHLKIKNFRQHTVSEYYIGLYAQTFANVLYFPSSIMLISSTVLNYYGRLSTNCLKQYLLNDINML